MPHLENPMNKGRLFPDLNHQGKNSSLSPIKRREKVERKKVSISPPHIISRNCSIEASLNPESIRYFKESYPVKLK